MQFYYRINCQITSLNCVNLKVCCFKLMRQISPNAKRRFLTVLTWKCASTNEAKLVPASVFCLSGSSLVAEVLTSRCVRAICSRKPTCVRAAKSLQLCSTLCYPMDCSPPGSFIHGDFPGKNTGVGCHALLQGIFLTQGSNQCLLCLLHWQAGF